MTPIVRELLAKTHTLYRAHFWIYLGYAFWILPPYIALHLTEHFLFEHPMLWWLLGVIVLTQVFIMLWTSICIIKATVSAEQTKAIDVNLVSTSALKLISPLLVVGLLQAIIVLGGTVLFIIPGIIFWVWYALAPSAVAIDHQRPMEALTTSRQLVKGRFWEVLWNLVAGPFVIMLVYVCLMMIVVTVGALVFGSPLEQVLSEEPPLWTLLLESGVDVVMIPVFLIYSTLLYLHLKSTKLDQNAPVV